jgi:site-specific recombinase XerD
MTVSAAGYWALVEGFLATKASANTRAAYRRDLTLLAEALGVPPAEAPVAVFGVEDDPEARAAARAMAELPAEWWYRWRDGLDGSATSRRRRVAGVRAFCKWWARLFALESPVNELAPPGGAADAHRTLGREIVALDQSQVRAMCEAAARLPGPEGARTSALLETLYGLGLRASEASALNLSDCHLDSTDDPYVIVNGKGSRQRAVAVPAAARAALLSYLSVGRPELRARDVKPRRDQARHRDADAVFLTARGRRLGRSAIWRLVQDVAAAAGLLADGQRIFPHALRHSCGTHLIQAGIDIRYVQAHLGHASPVTTEIYTHVTAAHLREDFDRAHPRSRRKARSATPTSPQGHDAAARCPPWDAPPGSGP